MSLHHGSVISRDGLVVQIDSHNQKCWKGLPTTNLCLLNAQNGVNPWWGDVTGIVVGAVHPDIKFRGRKVVNLRTGSAGNMYLNSTVDISPMYSTVFSLSFYVRKLDGSPLAPTYTGYCYRNIGNLYPTYTLIPVEDGWYKIQYTTPVSASSYVTLIGMSGMGADTDWLIADWQVEPTAFPSKYVFGSRSTAESILDLSGF